MFTVFKDLYRNDKKFAFGFTVILILIILVILSFFSPYDPKLWNVVPKDMLPSLKYPLGTNSMGQDIFWNMTHAIKNSLSLGSLTAVISISIGTIVGLIAGYRGGRLDRILMSINDSFIVLPSLPILILLSSILKEHLSIVLIAIILSLFSWPWGGRQVRAIVLSLREREFTYTANFSGMGTMKVVVKEHLPFVIPWVMANFINTILWAIGMETTLSIFGLSSLETPTIGTTIYWAVQYQAIFRGIWWWILTPVVIAVILFISLYMLSVSISNFLDPRTRLQRMIMEEKGGEA
ncbi:MAG: peptide ABC transporter [Dictyoglomus sp. NZ13-RE01]|nr:MAG: peptide ABC transporter [Dictyoglomus sp. NZ13-RE01]